MINFEQATAGGGAPYMHPRHVFGQEEAGLQQDVNSEQYTSRTDALVHQQPSL